MRRVRLDLQNGTETTRSFEVLHAWRESEHAVTSLVLLESPREFRGTSYLWAEDDTLPTGLAIFLRLPLGKRRVLTIEPGRFDEGLLGSDFAYTDLLWRVPTTGRRLRLVGDAPASASAEWSVESEPDTPLAQQTMAWRRILYHFSRDTGLLIGAEYYDRAAADGRAPEKTLRVAGWRQRDGVWTPSVMDMSRAAGRRSRLSLTSVKHHVRTLDASLFTPAALGTVAQQFENGTPPAVFTER